MPCPLVQRDGKSTPRANGPPPGSGEVRTVVAALKLTSFKLAAGVRSFDRLQAFDDVRINGPETCPPEEQELVFPTERG
jgi:hypothetical protein